MTPRPDNVRPVRPSTRRPERSSAGERDDAQTLLDADRSSVRELVAVCGGLDALVGVDDAPLEPVRADDVPLARRPAALLASIERVDADRSDWEVKIGTPPRIDAETMLVIRRLLRRPKLAAEITEHRSSDRRLAAAIAWLALKGNMAFGRRSVWRACDLWSWFGVSDASAIARSIAADVGMLAPADERWTEYPWTPIRLGDPSLLTARTRGLIVRHRDVAVRLARETAQRRERAKPLRQLGGGQVQLSARQIGVGSAMKVEVDGRQHLYLFVGDELNDPDEILMLSIPDARLLLTRVSAALDGPTWAGSSPRPSASGSEVGRR